MTQAAILLRCDALPILHEPTTLSHRRLIGSVVLGAAAYGAAMGSYSLLYGDPRQMLISIIKLPAMLLLTFGLSLPLFYVLTGLFGLRAAFPSLARAIVQGQLAFTILLGSLGPLVVMWYVSVPTYAPAVLVNGAAFAVASGGSHLVMRRLARTLGRGDRRCRWLILAWTLVYVFVGIQMGWVLRPFIGEPGKPVQWLRPTAWGNAYVEVVQLVGRALKHR